MSEPSATAARPLGGTEYSWCRAVPGGTGITVLGLLISKPPNVSSLESSLQKLQISHPLLRANLQSPNSQSPSFSVSPSPSIRLQYFDRSSTSDILSDISSPHVSPFHLLLERELNLNSWSELVPDSQDPDPSQTVFFASLYSLADDDSRCALVLRLHTSVCDRTSVVALSRELLGIMGGEVGGGEEDLGPAIELLVPKGKGDKPFWSHGMDLMGYSLNSFRLSNLRFEDACSRRSSEVVRLQMSREETDRLLDGCREREIKLCAALAAAGLIAVSSNGAADNGSGNYAIVTLVDCRKILDPALHDHNLGFYFSGILNTHHISRGEKLWDVAKRCYTALSNAKNCNKHFTDMGDLNFLMCKAIDNPGMTSSSSMRTAFLTVFEDSVVDDSSNIASEIGLEDYIGCSSVHGVGPSIAIFDTIRGGQLDCACVYPSPLHSRKQIQEFIDDVKRILIG